MNCASASCADKFFYFLLGLLFSVTVIKFVMSFYQLYVFLPIKDLKMNNTSNIFKIFIHCFQFYSNEHMDAFLTLILSSPT